MNEQKEKVNEIKNEIKVLEDDEKEKREKGNHGSDSKGVF